MKIARRRRPEAEVENEVPRRASGFRAAVRVPFPDATDPDDVTPENDSTPLDTTPPFDSSPTVEMSRFAEPAARPDVFEESDPTIAVPDEVLGELAVKARRTDAPPPMPPAPISEPVSPVLPASISARLSAIEEESLTPAPRASLRTLPAPPSAPAATPPTLVAPVLDLMSLATPAVPKVEPVSAWRDSFALPVAPAPEPVRAEEPLPWEPARAEPIAGLTPFIVPSPLAIPQRAPVRVAGWVVVVGVALCFAKLVLDWFLANQLQRLFF